MKKVVMLICLMFTRIEGNCNTTTKCDRIIHVKWWSIPPYIYEKDNEIKGLFPVLLDDMVKYCCGKCSSISYQQKHKSENELMKNISLKETALYLPVYGTMQETRIALKPFIPMIESPGIIYFVNGNKELYTISNILIKSISRSWPIVCIIMVGSAVSGIIIWALDCYWNPHQFPVNFFKGAWDGFWWACVSMTTVGYGDRAPKSFTARIFAFMWVLVGLIIFAFFNGAITASLTTASVSDEFMVGEQVLVLDGTTEKQFSTYANLNASTVDTVGELAHGLKYNENIKGALLDAYHAGHYREMFSIKNDVRVFDVIEHFVAYGIILNGAYEQNEMKKCFLRYLSLQNEFVTRTILMNTRAFELPETTLKEEKTQNIIDPKSTWFIDLVSVSCGILVLCIFIGLVWQHKNKVMKVLSLKSNKVKPKQETELDIISVGLSNESFEELLRRQCLELENAMKDEVDRFYARWNRKREFIKQLTFIDTRKTTTEDEQDNETKHDYVF